MSVAALFEKTPEFWEGEKCLRLSPNIPERVSRTSATLSLEARGQAVSIQYKWSYENQPQEGLLLISQSEKPNGVRVAWVDSWHVKDQMMVCEGFELPDCGISAVGTYPAPNGPDWGWRIVVVPQDKDMLDVIMYNITPEGEEHLAVEARYKPK